MERYDRLGIVGHEASKFTKAGEAEARAVIRDLIWKYQVNMVVSGKCHLGGIDIWAVEEAKQMGRMTLEHAPKIRSWSAPGGYRDRNQAIARDSDMVVCIVVDNLSPDYHGMKFPGGCYHCGDRIPPHIKSGGCWTAWQARKHSWVIVHQATSLSPK